MTWEVKRNKSSWDNSSCNLSEAVLIKQSLTITSHSPPDLGFNALKLWPLGEPFLENKTLSKIIMEMLTIKISCVQEIEHLNN